MDSTSQGTFSSGCSTEYSVHHCHSYMNGVHSCCCLEERDSGFSNSSNCGIDEMMKMRIFSSLMLNAWRRRRGEARHKQRVIDDLKTALNKSRSQMELHANVLKSEQSRNRELKSKLVCTLECMNKIKTSCEGLTAALVEVKSEKAILEDEIELKCRQIDNLNIILNETKSRLFHAMVDQRKLQSSVCKQQRSIQILENQKDVLINELCELNNKYHVMEGTYIQKLKEQENQLKLANERIQELEEKISNLEITATEIEEAREKSLILISETLETKKEVENLRAALLNSFSSRFSAYWQSILFYKTKYLAVFQKVISLLLPAVPPIKQLDSSGDEKLVVKVHLSA